ncbi:DUF1292 domain-containing protein [Apilactobacillus ozensis]|uniref:UPF0473 protein FD06_GL001166 n=1 Tax=Apilactobacillus ozensis DSM 23829 = JCM 17196 TaxID=1423781 RepID=A0A0R2AZ04_9LACO|nr:DUF1292 domain-containing protein [Apilactobacillus ozensis]KRM68387.1 hypothetical protein FD06_GL001166 [Apilactobacillus ozensis DSM 23829 = JCM 17196]MCK8607655.1 DUF1292 domain-containing protein [Apilactobacillus ozensis]
MSEEQEELQQITMVDNDGNEELYNVLFTFKSDDFGKSYILIYPAGKGEDEEVNIEAYALPKGDDPADPQGGDLKTIDTDEEWDMIESVLNTFMHEGDND